MYIERNMVSGRNGSKDYDDSDDEKEVEDNYTVWVISKDVNVVTPYTYDEAIALAGHGSYSVGLLVTCSISLMALIVDFFGFSTVVTNCSCDLGIGPWQRNVLLSMPYLGCIATAYVWGYMCDTRGRRLSLIVGMWGGFITTTLSAFSPNWIVLAALKFISVSFCSCAQSATYTLIGECCPLSVKRTYFFLLSSALNLGLPFYTALGYASLNMSFSYNLGFLTFSPWRLLVLCLGLPLGISAVGLHALYESPKFLTNIGEKGRALEILRAIWKRNRCVGRKYPVEKLILQEEGNAMMKEMPLLQSLWAQTMPLFKRPLLFRTLQLYFLTFVGFGTSNSLLSWFPFLVNAFVSGLGSDEVPEGMCSIIEHSQNLNDTTDSFSCAPEPNVIVIWASISQGLALFVISILICKVTNRKILVIALTAIIAASSIGCGIIEHNIISLVLFLTLYLSVVLNGIVAMYFVDLFPTSYRGMVGCLSIVVGRGGGLAGTIAVGLSIMTHCTITFYVIAGFILCGMVVACFLPSD